MNKLLLIPLLTGVFAVSASSISNGIERDQTHYATNVLHKVNVTETSNPFIVNGRTDYQLIVDDSNASAGEAASFLKRHLSSATGAVIVSVDDVTSWTVDDKYIIVGRSDLFEQAGLSMPSDNLGPTGYYVKSAGKSVFIEAKQNLGWRYGVFAFLKETIGYDFICDDTVVYSKDGSTLPNFDIIEKPDIDYKYEDNLTTSTEVYASGMLRQSQVFIGLNGKFVHNSLQYLPKSTYQAEHPGWYSDSGSQLCYTAHGDSDEYSLMIQAVTDVIKQKIEENPTTDNITLTIEDADDMCTCSECTRIKQQYAGTDSAAIIRFINIVSDNIDAYLEEKAEKEHTDVKEFNIVFFAYKKTEAAPVKDVEGGGYAPIDETVKCHKNVCVYIAPISAKYESSFYEATNEDVYRTITKWSVLSNKLYFWLYDTNFRNYLLPFNSFDSFGETMRFCKSMNAKFVVTEGQYNTTMSTAFNRFKIYLHSKYYFDVNSNFETLKQSYFKGYFKEASTAMLSFFDEMTANCRYVEATYPNMMNGNIYEQSEDAKYYPKALLERWLKYIDDAYAAIEKYKTSNPDLYQTLSDHITIESVFPRYTLIQLHGSYFSSSNLLAMKLSLKEDMTRLKISRYSEGGTVSGLWTRWGI